MHWIVGSGWDWEKYAIPSTFKIKFRFKANKENLRMGTPLPVPHKQKPPI